MERRRRRWAEGTVVAVLGGVRALVADAVALLGTGEGEATSGAKQVKSEKRSGGCVCVFWCL